MRHGRPGRHRRGLHDEADPRVLRTRERVLDAGRRLLLEEGPDAVTAVRISERTGVARTTIYRHWPDRATLLADVVGEEPAAETVEAAEATGDLRADLEAYLHSVVRRIGPRRGGPRMAAFMAFAHHSPDFADRQRRMAARRLAPLVALLEAHIECGNLPDGLDIEAAAAMLVGPIFFQRFFRGEEVSGDLVDDVVDAFVTAHGS